MASIRLRSRIEANQIASDCPSCVRRPDLGGGIASPVGRERAQSAKSRTQATMAAQDGRRSGGPVRAARDRCWPMLAKAAPLGRVDEGEPSSLMRSRVFAPRANATHALSVCPRASSRVEPHCQWLQPGIVGRVDGIAEATPDAAHRLCCACRSGLRRRSSSPVGRKWDEGERAAPGAAGAAQGACARRVTA